MGHVKSAGSSSHSIENTQLLQAYFFMVNSPLIFAFAAKTGKGQLTGIDVAAGMLLNVGAQFGGDRKLLHIQNRIAAGADEVNVGLGVGIESLRAVYSADAHDQALLFEQSQIPVDRCL